MNFSYENQGANTYLVYAVPVDESIDTMSLGMLTNNKIPGFAPAVFTQMDSTKYIKYNVSGKISVDQVFEGIVNRKRLLGVFSGIVDAMLCADEFMLDVNAVILDLKCMFTDVTTCQTDVICLPIICDNASTVDPKAFFKSVMFNSQFDQGENCDYIAKIIYYLNSNAEFSLVDFKKVLEDLNEDTEMPRAAFGKTGEEPKCQPASVLPRITPAVDRPTPQVVPQPVQGIQNVEVPPVPQATIPAAPSMPVAPVAAETQPQNEKKSWGARRREKAEAKRQKAAEKAAEKAAKKAAKKAGKQGGNAEQPAVKPEKQVAAAATPGFAVPGQETPVPAAVAAPCVTPPTVSPAPQPAAAVAPQIPTIPAAPSASVTVQAMSEPAVQQPNMPRETQPETGPKADFGDTNFFYDDADSETVIMSAAMPGQQIAPRLLRRKNNEKIPINKQIFRLGRDCDFNDYAIVDNKYIGHSHCHIITRDGEYFVLDDNSKNHTMVNATIIPSGVEVKIAHGDIVCLADEEFEFKLF